MNMQVILLKKLRLVRILRLHQAYRDLGRLFHHISELAGDDDLAISHGKQSLNIKDLSSHLSPGHTGHDTRIRVFQDLLMMHRPGIQDLPDIFRCDLHSRPALSAGTAA